MKNDHIDKNHVVDQSIQNDKTLQLHKKSKCVDEAPKLSQNGIMVESNKNDKEPVKARSKCKQ